MLCMKLGVGILTLLTVALAGCGSSHNGPAALTARELEAKVLPAPDGYSTNAAPHATGVITPTVFKQFGGAESPAKLGFLTGLLQSYVNSSTEEGIVVTLIRILLCQGCAGLPAADCA